MSQRSQAVQVIARHLLDVPVGGRIPTVDHLASAAGCGVGTVHAALKWLADERAIELRARGHLGTILESCERGRLWSAGGTLLRGALPLPTAVEFGSLATALMMQAEAAGVDLDLSFRQGARNRLRAAETGEVHFAVCSAYSADFCEAEATVELGPNTYYGRDSLCVISQKGRSPASAERVGIADSSFDHSALTRTEFPETEQVPAPYTRIPELVATGVIDAAVWHAGEASPLKVAVKLDLHPLTRSSPVEYVRMTQATVLAAPTSGLDLFLRDIFDAEELAAVQADVIDGNLPWLF